MTTKHPEIIYATTNGARTNLMNGDRYLVGGWAQIQDRSHAIAYTRSDLADTVLLLSIIADIRAQSGVGHDVALEDLAMTIGLKLAVKEGIEA